MKMKIKYSQSYRTRIEKPNTTEIPKGVILIEDWSVGYYCSYPYKAPELQRSCLYGHAINHPRFLINEFIKTSPIIKTKGRLVYTESGSVYFLGTIKPDYLNWLKIQGIPYDHDNPIKTRK